MELVHDAIPKASSLALLVNPTSPALAEAAVKDAQMAARDLGLGLNVLGAFVITTDALFISRSEQVVGSPKDQTARVRPVQASVCTSGFAGGDAGLVLNFSGQ
jgi:hypothetical protein